MKTPYTEQSLRNVVAELVGEDTIDLHGLSRATQRAALEYLISGTPSLDAKPVITQALRDLRAYGSFQYTEEYGGINSGQTRGANPLSAFEHLKHVIELLDGTEPLKKMITFCDSAFVSGRLHLEESDWAELSSLAAKKRMQSEGKPTHPAPAISATPMESFISVITLCGTSQEIQAVLSVITGIVSSGRVHLSEDAKAQTASEVFNAHRRSEEIQRDLINSSLQELFDSQ